MNRTNFLAGAGSGIAALASSSFGSIALANSPYVSVGVLPSRTYWTTASANIGAKMRALGYTEASDPAYNVTYLANGRYFNGIPAKKAVVNRPTGFYLPNGKKRPSGVWGGPGSITETVEFSFTLDDDPGELYMSGLTGGSTNQEILNGTIDDSWFVNSISIPFLGLAGIPAGGIYSIGNTIAECLSKAKDGLVGWAVAIATWIAHQPGFTKVMQTAATTWLTKWNQLYISAPAAAGATFCAEWIAAAIATLTVGEWIALAAAIGLTALAAFNLWLCLEGAPG